MSLDFVAIDFETANTFRGSPCAVGLVHVRDGHIIDSSSTLIHQDYFDPYFVGIHGITEDDVKDAPTFEHAWPLIRERIGGFPIVAHNAAFDTGVIRDALSIMNMPWPELTFACTLVMARRTYDLPSYRLPYVAKAAGLVFNPDDHHKAESDAELAARIMLAIAKRHEANDLKTLADTLNLRLGQMSPDYGWEGCKSKTYKARPGFGLSASDIPINPDADPENPLYGMGVTFTGTLGSMTRALAWQLVGQCGGMPVENVTKKTNLLVFGYQDARMLVPGASLSSKYQRALELKGKGADIEIIGEDDFLAMLQEAGIGNQDNL